MCYGSLTYLPGYSLSKLNPNKTITISPTENIYPDVNSSGFVEIKVSGRDYTDDLSKLDKIRNDDYYKKLPKDTVKGSPKLENRYNIQLDGKLDKDTEVKYSIEKEPDFPGKYNIYIKKDTSDLTFGDFNTSYDYGDYINVEKYLNGVQATTLQDQWRGKVTFGKEKSEPQQFEAYGNGGKDYPVGRSFLLEGSVIVYLNNKKLSENVDYSVNYYNGKIRFNKIINKIDYIKVIYEYTNPVQDFIPSLSRKNFTGINYSYRPNKQLFVDEFLLVSKNETIFVNDKQQMLSNRIQLNHYPIKLGSESIFLNTRLLTRGIHYYIKNDSGLLRFSQTQLNFDDQISINYQYYKTNTENVLINGDDTPGPFKLNHPHILPGTLSVSLGGIKAKEFVDYTYNSLSNHIEFYYNVAKKKPIEITYTYKESIKKEIPFRDSPFSISLTHLNESTSVREDSLLREDYSPASVSGNTILLQDNPIDQSKFNLMVLEVNGTPVPLEESYVNFYTGEITIPNPPEGMSVDTVTLEYYYLKSHLAEHSSRGKGISTYTKDELQFRSLPIKYKGISQLSVYINSQEYILDENIDYTVNYKNNSQEFKDIQLTFLLGGNSRLPHYPNNNDVIRISYFYTPSVNDTQSESNHQLTDVLVQTKINDNWSIYSEIANTKYNYSKTSKYNKDTFNQAPQDNKYLLSQSPLEEGSELVFINGFAQTRDVDYYINYEKGEISFINKTIPDAQRVEVTYYYYSSNTINKEDVNAYSIESNYTPNDQVKIKNKVNYVDPNFLPIGSLNLNQGSSKFFNSIQWDMNKEEYISFIFEKESLHNKNNDKLLTKDIFLTDLHLNVGVFDTSHLIRYEDSIATQSISEKTKKIIKYDNTVSYNFDDDRINVLNSISQKNEVLTPSQNLNSLISESKIEYVKSFTFFDIIDSGEISPYYLFNTDRTNSDINTSYKKKNIESIGFSTSSSYKKLLHNSTFFDKSIYKTTLVSDESFSDNYYNYSHTTSFMPFNWINTNVNISHDETLSPILGQENKVEDRIGYNILRIANDASLEYLNFPKYASNFFKNSYSTFGHLKTERRENNTLKLYNQSRYYGSFNSWKPLEGFHLPKFIFDTYKSSLSNSQKTSYQLHNSSKTKYYSFDTNFTYKPNFHHLNRLAFDASIKKSHSFSDGLFSYRSGTTNITENLLSSYSQKYGVNIVLPSVPLFITSIKSPILRLEHNSLVEKDENKTISPDITSNTNLLDNQFVSSNSLVLDYAVGIFNFNNSGLIENGYYNRNKVASSQGSLFKSTKKIDQSIDFSLFTIFKNNEYAKFERITQYKTSEIDLSPSQLKNDYTNYLNLDEQYASHKTEMSVTKILSLTGKFEYQDFTQKVVSQNITAIDSHFNQNTLTSGLILKPLSGLELTYDYSIKQLSSQDISKLTGYKDKVIITYNPIKYDNFSVQLNLSKEKNWGYGFNSIESQQLLQTSNESSSLEIISRDDEVYLGSFIMDVTLPINNSDHLEKIILSGEGYIKKIIDKFNLKNEYTISGFIFNIRMEL